MCIVKRAAEGIYLPALQECENVMACRTTWGFWLITVPEVTWTPLRGFQVITSMNQFVVCSHMKQDLMRCASTSHTQQQRKSLLSSPALFLPCAVEGCRGTSLHFLYRCFSHSLSAPAISPEHVFRLSTAARAWCIEHGAACFTDFPCSSADP